MDYVGVDHLLGLACDACRHTTAVRYSELLNLLLEGGAVVCDGCGRATTHDWSTIEEAGALVAKHMRHGEDLDVA